MFLSKDFLICLRVEFSKIMGSQRIEAHLFLVFLELHESLPSWKAKITFNDPVFSWTEKCWGPFFLEKGSKFRNILGLDLKRMVKIKRSSHQARGPKIGLLYTRDSKLQLSHAQPRVNPPPSFKSQLVRFWNATFCLIFSASDQCTKI